MLYARAQSKRPRTECAHTVWTDGWEEMNGPERAADRPSMRKARISIRWHQALNTIIFRDGTRDFLFSHSNMICFRV